MQNRTLVAIAVVLLLAFAVFSVSADGLPLNFLKLNSKAGDVNNFICLAPKVSTQLVAHRPVVVHKTSATSGAVCGNNVKEGNEECDGYANLGGTTCQTLGYDSGTLYCTNDCKLDLRYCAHSQDSNTGTGNAQSQGNGQTSGNGNGQSGQGQQGQGATNGQSQDYQQGCFVETNYCVDKYGTHIGYYQGCELYYGETGEPHCYPKQGQSQNS